VTFKTCTCGRRLKTTDVVRIGKDDSLGLKLLYVNCKFCGSTLTLAKRPDEQRVKAA